MKIKNNILETIGNTPLVRINRIAVDLPCTVLAKVEKIMDGKTTKYKVYLKNGKVLDAPEDKMSNFAALAPDNILEIVGMLPKPQTSPQTKPEAKKEQKQQ